MQANAQLMELWKDHEETQNKYVRARHQLDGAAVCRSQRFSLGLRSRGAKQVNLPAGEDHAHENYAEAHCEEQRAAQQRAALDDQRVLLPVLSQQGGQHGRGAERGGDSAHLGASLTRLPQTEYPLPLQGHMYMYTICA